MSTAKKNGDWKEKGPDHLATTHGNMSFCKKATYKLEKPKEIDEKRFFLDI